jgi:DNA-binding MarR family transcriptional regulator
VTRPKPLSDRRPVVIGVDTSTLVRDIGPVAWMVLVHLYGSPTAGTRSVTAPTRTLAAELGLSKDTCARALRTLRSADLITIDAKRTELGRFDTIRYRLTAPSRMISTRTERVDYHRDTTRRRTADYYTPGTSTTTKLRRA